MTGVTDMATYLEALFGRARRSTLVEVRWRIDAGMARRFVPVAERDEAAAAITSKSRSTDVYVGVLPRWRRAGGRAAVVGDSRTVWVDLDAETASRALEPVDPTPSLIVESGGPGHLHAYWTLRAAVPPAVVERANRRLAWALGGDLSSTDAARILRPPLTVNHGRGGVPVGILHADVGRRCRVGELVGGLLDPPSPKGRTGGARRGRTPDDALLAMAPERYVSVLTGLRVGRSRKVRCPLHEDRTPSLHVYDDPAGGWYCFGCGRGGSVIDLAAGMWGIEPHGAGFVAIRAGLEHRFGIR